MPVLVEVEALAEAELDMIAMSLRRKENGSLRVSNCNCRRINGACNKFDRKCDVCFY